jgi:hypothetical protein
MLKESGHIVCNAAPSRPVVKESKENTCEQSAPKAGLKQLALAGKPRTSRSYIVDSRIHTAGIGEQLADCDEEEMQLRTGLPRSGTVLHRTQARGLRPRPPRQRITV